MSFFSQRKILETPVFLDLFSERRFHLLVKFLHFVDNEKGHLCGPGYNCKNCRVALCASPFPALPYDGQLLDVLKGIKIQQMAKKCLNVRF
jgi:hypothetical protein